ncbi:hypothetical protein [Streptomyces iconiensis]|uniref:Uncharacterized protein n=1 Tax=Streptomyces iconiensis TaxID=1384038 RepID=A0ABT7A8Y1_9ACTN|nr:hypothetical protein [Streptomyces iconiensis]MDJ1137781.1 hypothetical protein [Streptomyces iconiensis]
MSLVRAAAGPHFTSYTAGCRAADGPQPQTKAAPHRAAEATNGEER